MSCLNQDFQNLRINKMPTASGSPIYHITKTTYKFFNPINPDPTNQQNHKIKQINGSDRETS